MIHEWRMRGRLQSYMDDELSTASRMAVSRHLTECAACAAAVRRLAETDQLLSYGRPTPPLPTVLTQAMLERALVESSRFPGGPGRGWPLLAWGLTAGLVVAATGAAAWWNIGSTGEPGVAGRTGDAPPGVLIARTYPDGEEGQQTAGPRSPRRPPPNSPQRRRSPSDVTPEPRPSQEKPRSPRTEPNSPPPSVSPGSGAGERPRRPRPPRYRLVQGPAPSMCGARTAAWWGRLTDEVEASEATASALRDELRLSEALACYTGVQLSVADETENPIVFLPGGPAEKADELLLTQDLNHPAPDGTVADQHATMAAAPVIEPTLDASSAPGALLENPIGTAPSPTRLLVMVSDVPEPCGVTVTQCPESTPGFARTIAMRPDGCGGMTWTQATVTTEEEPRLALVMLGNNAQWWE